MFKMISQLSNGFAEKLNYESGKIVFWSSVSKRFPILYCTYINYKCTETLR